MLKGIDGHNGVRLLASVRAELTDFFDTLLPRFHAGSLEHRFPDVDSNNLERLVLRQGDGIVPLAAAKINYYLSAELIEKIFA